MSKKLTTIYQKTNGITDKIDYTRERRSIVESNNKHLCWDCLNGSPAKCKKVYDVRKKSINDYDFIINGYQIIDKDNCLESFIVSKCNNFVLEEKKELTIQKKAELRQIRRELIMAYFGANDMEEAEEIREDMIKTGNLRPFDIYYKDKEKIKR